MLKVSVFGVKKCFFFFLWHSQHPIDCSRRFLMRGSILKGSVKFGLTKHFSDQSGHGRFSWPHCYGVNCTPLPTKGVLGGASGTEPACQCRRPKRGGFHPWVGKIPWRRNKLPIPVFLSFHSGSDGKEFTCNAGDLGWEDPLEEGMATHSSILAWRIPWTEQPGGLQSMRSQSTAHDWTTKYSTAHVPRTVLKSGHTNIAR